MVPVMDTKERAKLLSAIRKAATDEASAVAFLEARRWEGDPACPRCGSVEVYQMTDAKTGKRNKDFRWRCRDCKRMYTVRTGTVFEETRLPLTTWCHAFWRACASKKGISALQISRECAISYKSALFLMHRIRWAMTPAPGKQRKLKGTVEADETYVGGKPRARNMHQPGQAGRRGFRSGDKVPVVALVERGGDVRAWPVGRVTSGTLTAALHENISLDARLITDQLNLYKKPGRAFKGGHETVRHDVREYVRGDVYTNTVEGFFSLLKRQIYGTHHSVTREHLHRYVSEAAYKYNTRKMDDVDRVATAIKGAEGKRLLYKPPADTAA